MRGYVEMTAKLRGIYAAQKTAVENLAETAEPAPPQPHGPDGDYVVSIWFLTHVFTPGSQHEVLILQCIATPAQVGSLANPPHR